MENKIIWKDRKHLLWFPITFTKYQIIKDMEDRLKLQISAGLLHHSEEQIYLYKINDISYKRGLRNLIFGVGNIIIHSNDVSHSSFMIKKIKKGKKTMTNIENLVIQERKIVGVKYRETNVNDF